MYEQKYLKYKKKYIDLKNQLSFAQGDNFKQKYIDLKNQFSFEQGDNFKQKYKQFGGNLFIPRSIIGYWTQVSWVIFIHLQILE